MGGTWEVGQVAPGQFGVFEWEGWDLRHRHW